jgi:hypothetical protein
VGGGEVRVTAESQDQPRRHSGTRLCAVSLEQGSTGLDGQDFADSETYGIERWLGELARQFREKNCSWREADQQGSDFRFRSKSKLNFSE